MSQAIEKPVRCRPSRPLISPVNALVLSAMILGLFVVGSIWDLQISQALFDPTVLTDPKHANFFGVFGAAFGEIPAGLALTSSGALLIVYRSHEKTWAMVLQFVGGTLLFIIGAGMVMYLPTRYLAWHVAIVLVIGATVVAAATWGVLRIAAGVDRPRAIRVAVVLFLVVISELIIVNIVKIGWARPRMRMLEELAADGNTTLSFHAWWQPGTPEKAELIASGVTESEEFKSFPSGHTANATVLIMLTVLPVLREGLAKWKGLLFWIGGLWGLYVAFSRIVIGAHFLTDTMIGLTVTFLAILVAYRFFFPTSAQYEDETPGSL